MEEREGESCSRNRRRLENQEYKVRYGKSGVRHMGGMGGWAKKITSSAFHRGAHCRLGVGESLSKGPTAIPRGRNLGCLEMCPGGGDFEARILNACAFTNAEIVCPRSHLICLCVQPPPPPATTLSLRRHTSHSLSSSATSPLAPCVRVCTNTSRDRPPVFAPPVFAALSRDKPPPPPDAGEYDHNGREARGSALWRPDL